jgi:hypothetical protein
MSTISLILGVFEKGEGKYIGIAIGKYKLIWNQSPNLAPRTCTRRCRVGRIFRQRKRIQTWSARSRPIRKPIAINHTILYCCHCCNCPIEVISIMWRSQSC